jgi:type IX secretion system substrate protein
MKQKHIRQRFLEASRLLASMVLVVLFAVAAGYGTAHATDPATGTDEKTPNKENKTLSYFGLDSPIGIAVDSARGRIIYSDAQTAMILNKIEKGEKDNQTLSTWDDLDGFLFCSNLDTAGYGYHYDHREKFLDSIISPMGMMIIEDTLYIADYYYLRAINLNDTSEVFTFDFKTLANDAYLYDIERDTSGNIYISDYYRNTLFRIPVGGRTASKITFKGETSVFPSALIFDKENNRLLMGTAEDIPDSSALIALDVENDSCYKIMDFGFRNVAGITRDDNGDYYLSQGNWIFGSYIYKLKGDFSEPPLIISEEVKNSLSLIKMIPGSDTLLFNEVDVRDDDEPIYRENTAYTRARPTLVSPRDGNDSLAKDVRLKWRRDVDSLALHGILTLQIQDSTGAYLRKWHGEVSTYFDYGLLEYGKNYRWFVQGLSVNEFFRAGLSDTSYFHTYHPDSIARPTLVSPADSTDSLLVHFDLVWNEFPGATRYWLEYSEWDGTSDNRHSFYVEDTTYTIYPARRNCPYWWKVKITDDELSTDWSEVNYCRSRDYSYDGLDTAMLYYPQLLDMPEMEYGIPANLTFEWGAVAGATEYIVELGPNEVYFTTDTTLTYGLDSNETYHWGVRAINDSIFGNRYDTYFVTGDSTIQTPGMMSAKRFYNDELRPTLYWGSTGATEYEIVVTEEQKSKFGKGIVKDHILQADAEDWDWKKVIVKKYVETNYYKFEEDLDPESIYKWRIRARIVDSSKVIPETWNTPRQLLSDYSDPMKFKLEDIEVGVGDSKYGINVYPNPISKGNLLFLESNEKLIDKVEIIDNLGQLVYSSKLNMNSKNHIVNTGNIQSGSYYLRISIGKEVITRKFVVI